MQHVQLAPGLFFNAAERLDDLTQPESFGRAVTKRSDHSTRAVYRRELYVKRITRPAPSGGDLPVFRLVNCCIEIVAMGPLFDRFKINSLGEGRGRRAHIELAGDDIGNEAGAKFLRESHS